MSPSSISFNFNSTAPRANGAVSLIHDEEYWMDDGSIILIAKCHGFKVYKGILAAQSPVFRDMFASASPSKDDGVIGGQCPVVHLSDSPEDLRHFLRAVIPVNQPMLHRGETDPKISAEALIAIGRLAHKYQADELQRQALTCLQEYYTTSFGTWERKGQKGDVPFETSDVPIYAIGVLHLARLTNAPSMLPLAFYDCVQLGGKVVDGWRHEDGSVERLDDEDLRRCLDGVRALASRAAEATAAVLGTAVTGCRSSCDNYGRLKTLLGDVLGRTRCLEGPLHAWTDLFAERGEARKMCQACREAIQVRAQRAAGDIWPDLPSIFNVKVDGWPS